VDVPGKRVPSFTVGKAIRELVNRPRPDQAASLTAPQSAGAGQCV
jgi:hypothetical protein